LLGTILKVKMLKKRKEEEEEGFILNTLLIRCLLTCFHFSNITCYVILCTLLMVQDGQDNEELVE
jgi:hypothetical protein